MANGRTTEVLGHLSRSVSGRTDGQLLADYLGYQDPAALAAVARRHGPMVWGVCRRLLRNHHDAEDAFQATFLVLVRKAASITSRDLLANWLYGVAHQTALNARAAATRRSERECQVAELPEPAADPVDPWTELRPVLDRELTRLPDKYRVVVLLCDLEGLTRTEAARQLGVPEGTVAGRLARARMLLARRLARHGLALSGGALAALLARHGALAGVPNAVASSTIQSITRMTAGSDGAAGIIPAPITDLTEGVLRTMFLSKLKTATVVVLTVAFLGTGVGWLIQTTPAQAQAKADKVKKPAAPTDGSEVTGVVRAIDAAKGTLTLQPGKTAREAKTFDLAKDVQVLLDDGSGEKLGFKDGKLTDVSAGSQVTVRLGDEKKVIRVFVDGPTVHGTLSAVDATKGTITVAVAKVKGQPPADTTFTVGKATRITIDDGQPKDKTKTVKQANLADVPANAIVSVKLSADRKVVGSLRAEGQTVTGTLKAVDAARNAVTITISVKGQPDEEKTYPVAADAPVFIDDGKTKEKVKPMAGAKLTDLPVGSRVVLKLAVDGKSALTVRAEGGNVHGTVKEVDAAKGTLTVNDKAVPEGKTFTVAADVQVFLDGKEEARKLADLPAGAVVDLKLLSDQKTVRDIRATGQTMMGAVAANAGPDSVTLRTKEGDKTYSVPANAPVRIDEGREGKLTELIEGSVARVRLSVDGATVLEVQAEGPSYQGKVKGFDPDKDVVTVTVGSKMNVEDKEFKLVKDSVVQTEIYKVPLPKTDLRPDAEVVLRMFIDQKAAARITVKGQ